MELRHLRYFAAVAEHLNYSEASRRLHVAQPAISQTILDLEEELGVPLFTRTRRSVQLTAAGKLFQEEAAAILLRTENAKRLARRAALGEIGRLNIGFFGSATAPILPLLVQSYRKAHPEVELQLHELNPDRQLEAFGQGLLDVALTRTLPASARETLEEETVYVDHLAVALPFSHRLARKRVIRLQDLSAENFVQFHRHGAPGLFDDVIATCRRAGFSPRIVNEPDFMATVMTLVESGLGVSLIPAAVKSLNRPRVVVRPISPKSEGLPLCLVWPKDNRNPTVVDFLKLVRTLKPKIRSILAA